MTGAEVGPRLDGQQGDICGLAVGVGGVEVAAISGCQSGTVSIVGFWDDDTIGLYDVVEQVPVAHPVDPGYQLWGFFDGHAAS